LDFSLQILSDVPLSKERKNILQSFLFSRRAAELVAQVAVGREGFRVFEFGMNE